MPSKDTLTNGTIFSTTCELYQNLSCLSERVNEAVRLIDPKFHLHLSTLRSVSEQRHPVLKCLNSIDPLLFEGRELLFNRRSQIHRDRQDPPLAYAGLFAAGNFTSGGYLVFPLLGPLRIRLRPGDFSLVRGRILEHMTEEWDGGQRIGIPHFTHTALWRNCGLAHLVSTGTLPDEDSEPEYEDYELE
jgi:hypothetical protein